MEKTAQIVGDLVNQIKSAPDRSRFHMPTESELCEQYETSRSTVREALKILQYFGIVKSVRGAGYSVTLETEHFSETAAKLLNLYHFDYRQIGEVREALDLKELSLIQQNGFTEQDIQFLNSCVDEMQYHGTRAVNADLRFHQKLAELSGNDLLIAITSSIARYSKKYMEEFWSKQDRLPPGKIPELINAHRGIIDMISQKKEILVNPNSVSEHYRLSNEFIVPLFSPERDTAGNKYTIAELLKRGWNSQQIAELAREIENARSFHAEESE